MKIEFRNYIIESDRSSFILSIMWTSDPIRKRDWTITPPKYWVRDQKFPNTLLRTFEIILDYEQKKLIDNTEIEKVITELKNLNTQFLIDLKEVLKNEWLIKDTEIN